MPDGERAILADFVDAVAPAGLSARELAESLWLAEWISRSACGRPGGPGSRPDGEQDAGQDAEQDIRLPERVPVSIPTATGGRRLALENPSPRQGREPATVVRPDPDRPRSEPLLPGVAAVRVPRPIGSEAVRYARSLRRLRPVPVRRPDWTARDTAGVDEVETARFAAETGLAWPVHERRRPRRGVAKVVLDTSVSMQVWTGFEDDVVSALSLSRVFRRVELWFLHQRDGAAVVWRAPGGGPERALDQLSDPSGDGAVIILSDGVSRLWYSGNASAAAGRLAAVCPVTLIQPLPNRLWRRTGLRPKLATVKGAPRGVDAFHLARTGAEHGAPAVPIVEADESWLGTWAALASGRRATARFAVLGGLKPDVVPPGSGDRIRSAAGGDAGTGSNETAVGSLLGFDSPQSPQSSQSDGDGDSAEPGGAWSVPAVSVMSVLPVVPAVSRFRAAASQGARELAVALSVVPLSLPIMQLVLATCFPDRSRVHLAEVITGGLMQRDPAVREGDGPPMFKWLPGVAEELRREVDHRRAEQVHAALSHYLDSELGFRPDSRGFVALVAAAAALADRPAQLGSPFASILRDTVHRVLNRSAPVDTVPEIRSEDTVAQRAARALALARAARNTGRSAEIDEAIEAARLAVNDAGSRDWDLTEALADLLEQRRGGSGSALDMEEAVIVLRDYADRTPTDDPHRRECLDKLADALLARYRATESSDLLDEAIEVRRELAEAEDAPQEQVLMLAESLLEHHRLTGSSLSVYEATDLMGDLRAQGLPDRLRAPATALLARGLDVMSRSTRDEEDIAAADTVWLSLMADLGDLSAREAVATRSAIEARIRFHQASGRAERAHMLADAFGRVRGRLGPEWGSGPG